jgi:hypothetical protein
MSDELKTEGLEDDPFAGYDWGDEPAGESESVEEPATPAVPPDQIAKIIAKQAKIEENQKKMLLKQHAKDEAEHVENSVKGFYADATDEEKEMAAIYLEGAETPSQVERAIALIHKKSGRVPGSTPADAAAVAPPSADGTAPAVKDQFTTIRDRALSPRADRDAKFELWMATQDTPGGLPPVQEESVGPWKIPGRSS